jgi:hypothetical protein
MTHLRGDPPPGRRRRQRRRHCTGQALVGALALFALGALALVFVDGSARVVTTREQLAQAADAAALSAATWRARVLNFDAYVNRAIVLEEVAMAQATTLQSWALYFQTLMQDSGGTLAAAFPQAAGPLSDLAAQAQAVAEATQATAALESWLLEAPQVGYKPVLQASQSLMHELAAGPAIQTLSSAIVQQHDAAFDAWVLSASDRFSGFTRLWDQADDRLRLRDVVWRSLDAFVTGPRSFDEPLEQPSRCAAASLSPQQQVLWLRRRGATVMLPDSSRWQAVDTASIHDEQLRSPNPAIGCADFESVPVGWAAAQAGIDPTGPISPGAGGFLGVALAGGGLTALADPEAVQDNPMAALLAGAQRVREPALTYSGLAAVRELDEQALAQQAGAKTPLAVLAGADGQQAGAGLAGLLARLLRTSESAATRLWALSAAEAYFSRPPTAGALIEYPSLYNPYWQARLIEPSPEQRTEAQDHVSAF